MATPAWSSSRSRASSPAASCSPSGWTTPWPGASEFGGELDSLADAVSFGGAPALLAYSWGFSTLPRVGWLAAFLFVVCGLLRLARFNVQRHAVDGRFFVGLPVPAAAAQVAAWVNLFPDPLASRAHVTVALALVVMLSFLMVSTFRY